MDFHKQSILSSLLKAMVVGYNREFVTNVGEFLCSHSFKVTCVDKADTALKLLSDEKADFDVLLLDSDMRDDEMIKLLLSTKDMNILKIVMKEEADDAYLLKALDNGASLVVEKRLTKDTVIEIRQNVIRERIQKSRQFGVSTESAARKRMRTLLAKRKPCIVWTEELHSKFIRVVRELGDGNCFPTTILKAMGVPGLTRLQVASHLQSLRNKGIGSSSNNETISSNHSQNVDDIRKFGYVPLAATDADNLSRNESAGDKGFGTHAYDDIFQFLDGMEGEDKWI